MYLRASLIISTIALIANTFWFNNVIVGIIFFALYMYSLVHIAHDVFFSKKNIPLMWSAACIFSFFSIAHTTIYYVYKITPLTSATLLALPLLLLLFYKKENKHDTEKFYKESFGTYTILGIFLILEIILFSLLYTSRTTDISNSPWLHLPSLFFFIYFCATCLTLTIPYTTKNKWIAYTTTSLHLFLTYSVAIIIYPLGYGFDGFIHRATETWISQNGFILPKQPVYIGQYSFIVFLHHISAVPIFYLDILLVPVLAAFALPGAVAKTISHVFKVEETRAINLVWLLPVLFYVSLHLTTPHNILVLLFILIVCSVLLYLHNKLPFFIPLTLSIAGLCIHALLGAPLFLFTIAAYISHKYKKLETVSVAAYGIGISFLFPILFSLYFILSKNPLPTLSNPFHSIRAFIELFKRPYWYEKSAPLFWEVIYRFEQLLPFVLLACGVIAFLYIAKRKQYSLSTLLFLFSCGGFWVGAFLLRSWIHFPNVGAFEQGDYPMRLIKTSTIFLLPFLMYGAYLLSEKIISKKKIYKILLCIVASGIITTSFYLSYPQENKKVHFPGYNVTAADFEAAKFIHDKHSEYNYIVLSNPLTAIAAMELYGFPKYFETKEGLHSYYAIPTGARLFNLYQDMLYKGQKREFMIEAMEFTGANTSYFVVSSFWSNFEKIVDGAKLTADSWHMIDNGNIFIFEYKK